MRARYIRGSDWAGPTNRPIEIAPSKSAPNRFVTTSLLEQVKNRHDGLLTRTERSPNTHRGSPKATDARRSDRTAQHEVIDVAGGPPPIHPFFVGGRGGKRWRVATTVSRNSRSWRRDASWVGPRQPVAESVLQCFGRHFETATHRAAHYRTDSSLPYDRQRDGRERPVQVDSMSKGREGSWTPCL